MRGAHPGFSVTPHRSPDAPYSGSVSPAAAPSAGPSSSFAHCSW
uniref:Uncharacterized protein n=1 Tax=Arundo donax TaxID=35708 RepID=A0A0A9DBV9_ARUDO